MAQFSGKTSDCGVIRRKIHGKPYALQCSANDGIPNGRACPVCKLYQSWTIRVILKKKLHEFKHDEDRAYSGSVSDLYNSVFDVADLLTIQKRSISSALALSITPVVNDAVLIRRAVPTSIESIRPYDISTQKYREKIESRSREQNANSERVQRAIEKLDVVQKKKQSGIKAIVDKNHGILQQIVYELNLLREDREKAYWKMHAYSVLQSELTCRRQMMEEYLRLEQIHRSAGYRSTRDHVELQVPEGVPTISLQEIHSYFPKECDDNPDVLAWQTRMLQAAKMTSVNPSLYDPFVNEAIINDFHRDANQAGSSATVAASEEYQKAMWELKAVVEMDAEAASKAFELHHDTNLLLVDAITELEVKYQYYKQKCDAWNGLSAKRPRRV